MRKKTLLSLLLILILIKSVSAQLMIKEVSLSNQIDKSTLVLEGRVLSKKSYWDINHEKIYTVNTVEVYKVFKGETQPIIEIITLGGVVDLEAQIVYPSLKLRKGDLGVFTLYNNNLELDSKELSAQRLFKPYGSLQGFYKYDLDNDIAANQFTSKKGITSDFYDEIKNHTKSDYIQLSNFDVQDKTSVISKASSVAVVISGFSPTISSAGTQSVLTITGSNFGTAQGTVSFSNADNAGAGFVNALDSQILTWTNSSIAVEIPSQAGTGRIRVAHNDGTAMTSVNSLIINNAQANIVTDMLSSGTDVAYQTQLIGDNGNGGYFWKMTSDFAGRSGAKDAFKRALNTWSCETQINWDLDESSMVTSSSVMHRSVSDGMNVIAFDDSTSSNPDDDLPDTVLGLRTSYYSGCSVNVNGSPSLAWYVLEFDIIFDDESSWNFNSHNPADTEFDFESVALHELGHCRQLDHIIDTNNVMHYAIAKGESLRFLSSDNVEIANMIQDKSTEDQVCGQSLMTNFSGSCALGVEEDKLNEGIQVYPNPTKGNLFISSDGLVNLEKAIVYDLSGRLIAQQDLSNTSRLKTIQLNNISKGIYFVNIHSETTFITKKIILE